MFNCFKKTKPEVHTSTFTQDFRWVVTEIYDKPGKDNKLVRSEKELQWRPDYISAWRPVYNNYNTPIYLEDK